MLDIKVQFNKNYKAPLKGADISICNKQAAEKARKFHKSFPMYQVTPLARLKNLAQHCHFAEILVKDESYRFGLNAFKVLGGSYAVGEILAKNLGKDLNDVDFKELSSEQAREKIGNITLASTTDGNHGRGLAWAAQQFHQKAIIFMPKGSEIVRRDHIRALGATCEISDLNYDDCVSMAWDKAQQEGWLTVQDTAWEGYTEIPNMIMQGYSTLSLETLEQMEEAGIDRPTHIFLQAGVGCFAGAMLSFFMSVYGEKCPKIIIVEPHAANCHYVSAVEGDGKAHTVGGDLATLMAGLACGKPNITTWEMLRDYPTAYISCPDSIAAQGMRILGNPIKGDEQVISGESGAVTLGLVHWLSTDEGKELREQLEMNENSKILCFSTEGDTSPKTYRDIAWFNKTSL